MTITKSQLKRVIILGGAGFIGSNIARQLLQTELYEVTIADNLSRGSNRVRQLQVEFPNECLTVLNIDLTDFSQFNLLGQHYDYVYMLAAMVGVDKVNAMPHEVVRVNSLLTLNCLEWLRSANCKRVVFSSTSEVYAGTIEAFAGAIPTPEDIPLTIESIGHPRFSYAVTKMLGESGFISYANQGYFDAVVVRYHNVYGPDMGFRHVIPHLVERFLKKEDPFLIYGHDQTRSFNFIDDAAKGTILAVEKGRSGEIFHIGDDDEISIETLTRYVGELIGYEGSFQSADTFPGSVSRRCPNIEKARDELGYGPSVDWRKGVMQTVDWYREFLENDAALSESFYDQYGIRSDSA